MEEDLFEDKNERKKSGKHEESEASADEASDVFAEDERNTEEIQINDAIEEVFNDFEEKEAVENGNNENWIPLDDEEGLDIPEEDADIEKHEEIEEIDLEDVLKEDEEEAGISVEKEGEKIGSEDDIEDKNGNKIEIDDILEDFDYYDETEVSNDGDDKAWIPLDDEDELETKGDDDDIGVEEGLEEDVAENEEEEELDLEKIIEEEGLDISNGIEDNAENAEAPPWEEEVEIPLHGTTKTPKKKKTILIAFIFFLVALTGIGLYGFYQFKMISEKQKHIIKGEEPSSSHVIKKTLSKGETAATPVTKAEEKPLTDRLQVAENALPLISGEPLLEAHEGILYRFLPQANDEDLSDILTFFIANQPVWTSFDTTTGALTGTPDSEDVGIYKRIAILVTDGRATASLPVFDIIVTGTATEEVKKKNEGTEPVTPIDEKKPEGKPVAKINPVKEKETIVERDTYSLPDLTELIKQMECLDAALEYHKTVRDIPQAYSLKLEVDCVEKSVQVAYQACDFDPRMFILPRQINGRNCFIVFWGLYHTKNEALKALSSVPAFFENQETKPKLIILKQYL